MRMSKLGNFPSVWTRSFIPSRIISFFDLFIPTISVSLRPIFKLRWSWSDPTLHWIVMDCPTSLHSTPFISTQKKNKQKNTKSQLYCPHHIVLNMHVNVYNFIWLSLTCCIAEAKDGGHFHPDSRHADSWHSQSSVRFWRRRQKRFQSHSLTWQLTRTHDLYRIPFMWAGSCQHIQVATQSYLSLTTHINRNYIWQAAGTGSETILWVFSISFESGFKTLSFGEITEKSWYMFGFLMLLVLKWLKNFWHLWGTISHFDPFYFHCTEETYFQSKVGFFYIDFSELEKSTLW